MVTSESAGKLRSTSTEDSFSMEKARLRVSYGGHIVQVRPSGAASLSSQEGSRHPQVQQCPAAGCAGAALHLHRKHIMLGAVLAVWGSNSGAFTAQSVRRTF